MISHVASREPSAASLYAKSSLAPPLLRIATEGIALKYGIAWLLGVPFSLIVVWFLANQIGC